MSFKTLRGRLLNEQDMPIQDKLGLAAIDYHRATTDPTFTDEWGSESEFQHDLFIFVQQYLVFVAHLPARTAG
jgi:hypothetical protein